MRRFGAERIVPEGQGVENDYSLGHPLYPAPKGNGDNSIVEKQLRQKVCMAMRCKSCVHEVSQEIEVKPGLAESQFPGGKSRSHRSIPDTMTPD